MEIGFWSMAGGIEENHENLKLGNPVAWLKFLLNTTCV
jgi:hypothetical protein